MLEDLIIVIRVVLPITYAWHVIRFMKNINLVHKAMNVPKSMELNMKHTLLAYFPTV